MYTTQRLNTDTLTRIRNRGKLGDSFDSVLVKLLDQVETKQVEEREL